MSEKNRTVWPGKKAVVFVQPSTLLESGVISPNKKASFEAFVLDAKKRGAHVFLVTYSHVIWWELAEISDFIFVFLTKKGFKKYIKNENERGLSKKDIQFLLDTNLVVACEKKENLYDLCDVMDGLKVAYEDAAVFFQSQLSKSDIKNIILCGGFDTLCVKFFLLAMAKRMPDVEIIVSTKFLAQKDKRGLLLRTMERRGLHIDVGSYDETYLLKLI